MAAAKFEMSLVATSWVLRAPLENVADWLARCGLGALVLEKGATSAVALAVIEPDKRRISTLAVVVRISVCVCKPCWSSK